MIGKEAIYEGQTWRILGFNSDTEDVFLTRKEDGREVTAIVDYSDIEVMERVRKEVSQAKCGNWQNDDCTLDIANMDFETHASAITQWEEGCPNSPACTFWATSEIHPDLPSTINDMSAVVDQCGSEEEYKHQHRSGKVAYFDSEKNRVDIVYKSAIVPNTGSRRACAVCGEAMDIEKDSVTNNSKIGWAHADCDADYKVADEQFNPNEIVKENLADGLQDLLRDSGFFTDEMRANRFRQLAQQAKQEGMPEVEKELYGIEFDAQVGGDWQVSARNLLEKLQARTARKIAEGELVPISDLGDEYKLITDSQDVAETLSSVGLEEYIPDTGMLFVKYEEDSSGSAVDYDTIYGTDGTVPYDNVLVHKLYGGGKVGELKVKFAKEDVGNARKYYKGGGRLYCAQDAGRGQSTFYLCSKDGEPQSEVKRALKIVDEQGNVIREARKVSADGFNEDELSGYINLGMDEKEAAEWYRNDFTPDEADSWKRNSDLDAENAAYARDNYDAKPGSINSLELSELEKDNHGSLTDWERNSEKINKKAGGKTAIDYGVSINDPFVLAYLGALLWSSTDDNDEPLDKNYSVEDITEDAREKAVEDCGKFKSEAAELLQEAENNGYDTEQAGHDFALTRNRHGAGFWDREEIAGEIGKKLTDIAHEFGEYDLYYDGGIDDPDGSVYSGKEAGGFGKCKVCGEPIGAYESLLKVDGEDAHVKCLEDAGYDVEKIKRENKEMNDRDRKVRESKIAGKMFTYSTDLDERGEFEAHVENSRGDTVYQIDTATIQAGHDFALTRNRHGAGLWEYLVSVGIMQEDDTLFNREITEYVSNFPGGPRVHSAIFSPEHPDLSGASVHSAKKMADKQITKNQAEKIYSDGGDIIITTSDTPLGKGQTVNKKRTYDKNFNNLYGEFQNHHCKERGVKVEFYLPESDASEDINPVAKKAAESFEQVRMDAAQQANENGRIMLVLTDPMGSFHVVSRDEAKASAEYEDYEINDTVYPDKSSGKRATIDESNPMFGPRPMHITLNEALDALRTGDEDTAWEIAQQDEGLNPGVTKEQWLAWAYKIPWEGNWEQVLPENIAPAPKGLGSKKAGDLDDEPVRVVFKDFDGEVLALFPDETADQQGNILSYQHMGQHSGASRELLTELPTLSLDDPRVEELREELAGQGYKLMPIEEDSYEGDPYSHKSRLWNSQYPDCEDCSPYDDDCSKCKNMPDGDPSSIII